MKKLQAILKGCNFVDQMFSLREKQIKTAYAAAQNDIEEQETEAKIEYEKLCKRFGDREVKDYKKIFNDLIRCKDVMKQAKETRALLDEIEKDLNSEVQLDEGKAEGR